MQANQIKFRKGKIISFRLLCALKSKIIQHLKHFTKSLHFKWVSKNQLQNYTKKKPPKPIQQIFKSKEEILSNNRI